MKVIVTKDYAQLSQSAAKIIAEEIKQNSKCVLGLATGSTPIGTYNDLIQMNKSGEVDFANVKTFNLDEYCGLDKENIQSYWHFMHEHLFNHININRDNVNMLDGTVADEKIVCSEYENLIVNCGGIDLQLLGCGHNGHIAFNEPAEIFSKSTHKVALQESTINANKRMFNDISEVPTFAYTMGIKTIMNAKKILMIVNGKDKAKAINEAFNKDITPMVPASVLQLHNDFILILDEDAASEYLKNK